MGVEIAELTNAIHDKSLDWVEAMAEEFAQTVRDLLAPHRDTGTLESSVTIGEPAFSTRQAYINVSMDVGVAPYALFVEEGTGIYGPQGTRIYPVTARALVFEWGGETVAFASVAGMQPVRYWDQALELWPEIVRLAESRM